MTIDHFEALFDAKYLRWFDIVEKGEAKATIGSVAKEELTMRGGVKKKSPVVTISKMEFPEMEPFKPKKQWVLNRTNAEAIAKIHGNKPSEWAGKTVTLVVAQTQLFNQETRQMETVNCIRVQEVK